MKALSILEAEQSPISALLITSMAWQEFGSEPVSYAAVEEDGTCGLVIEVFDDLDKVCTDVVLLHGCPQSCMPNPCRRPS